MLARDLRQIGQAWQWYVHNVIEPSGPTNWYWNGPKLIGSGNNYYSFTSTDTV
ncbi:hypothetical protein NBRC116601_34350 [Cognatishimia sp. WU-CL00825]